jgi:hypothetical protein
MKVHTLCEGTRIMTYPRLAAVLLAMNSFGLLAAPRFALDNPLARPTDAPKAFAGEFAGDNVKLSLVFDAASKAYRGEVAIADAKYPCTAAESNGSLAGSFVVGGQSYNFTATLAGDQLNLVSDGTTHKLTKTTISPKNPLAGGSGPPAPAPNLPAAPQPMPTPNPIATGPAGGVGIGFETTEDGLVIRALMPGGAGEKAKLKLGGILCAIDGKDVDDLKPEQIRSLLAGDPGTLVKLTIEYDDEVTDAILQRTALNQPPQPQQPQQQPERELVPQPPAQPPQGKDPRMAPGDGRPMVNGPAVLKPGLRVTYFMGSSSMPGARTTLVQDDQGNWIDPGTGQRFAEADNPSTGGAGIHQITVVAADARDLAVDARSYTYMDIQQGLTVLGALTSYVGTSEGLGEFWQPPAKLAAMHEGDEAGLRVRRMQYPVNGKTFNAITITNHAGGGGTYTRNVFDLETGLLIAASSSTTGGPQVAPNPNGTAGQVAGVTTITSTRIMDIRQVDTPWLGQSLPAWAKPNTNLDYAGTYSTVMEGAPAIQPWQLQARLSIGEARGSWMPIKQYTRLSTGMSQPQDSETTRALGAGVLDPVWIDPNALARLRPNTVLDEDKITKRRTTFLGVQGNLAVFGEEAPYERRQYGYDTRSGTLVSIDNRQQQGPATIVTQLQLTQLP